MAKKKEQYGNSVIQARVSDFHHGLRVFENIQMIRVRSLDYSLLILDDYLPIIAKIEGDVELVRKDEIIPLHSVKGFFMHRDNVFSLLIEEQDQAYIDEIEENYAN